MATTKARGRSRRATDRPSESSTSQTVTERRIAEGIKKRREALGLSANDLAERTGVSRAMVSKIERLDVSPTAALLGRLCNGLGMTLSSLIASAESGPSLPIARASAQPVWRDPETGLRRTMVSPLNTGSRMELVQIELPSGAEVKYGPQHNAYDQHVWVLQGVLTLTIDQDEVELSAGDCMCTRVDVAVALANRGRSACRYLVAISR